MALNKVQRVVADFPRWRNYLINGDMGIWQRGTSQSGTGFGSVDRWGQSYSQATSVITQQTHPVAAGLEIETSYFLRCTVTSAAHASENHILFQKIEDVRTLAGKNAILSFWAKADSTLDISIEFLQNFGSGGSATVDSIEVNKLTLSTSWQQFKIPVTIPSISGKTVGTSSFMNLIVWTTAGPVFDSRTDSLGLQSGVFDFDLIQLEEGSTATPFESRPQSVELQLCQRYFEKSYDIGSVPPTNTDFGAFLVPMADAASTVDNGAHLQFKVPKRAYPTFTYWDIVGNSTRWSRYTSGGHVRTDNHNPAINFLISPVSGGVRLTMGGNYYYGIHWTADAEL